MFFKTINNNLISKNNEPSFFISVYYILSSSSFASYKSFIYIKIYTNYNNKNINFEKFPIFIKVNEIIN